MKLILNDKYRKVGDQNCYNLISTSIHVLNECKFIKTISDFNNIIQKYAANDLPPIFKSTLIVDKEQNKFETFYFTPLYIGPLSKDFCNKHQLPYKDVIDENIKSDEMKIRFNPNLLYLIPNEFKPLLIGMVEVDKNSLYNKENSELMGICYGDMKRYIPNYYYGKKLMLLKNIYIWSEAEEILYFKDDIPDIQIDENEISNSAYSYIL